MLYGTHQRREDKRFAWGHLTTMSQAERNGSFVPSFDMTGATI